MSVIRSRLEQFRSQMRHHQIDAYVVFSSDPHISEYLPAHYQGRAWLSGFDGSAGSLVITHDFAGLWTDSRYWVQAEADLAQSPFTLMRWGDGKTPDMIDWVGQHLSANQCVAMDGQVVSLASFGAWQHMAQQQQLCLRSDMDLLDLVWLDRPALPKAPVFLHQAPFNQRSLLDNIASIRHHLDEHEASHHLLSSLDDIAWVLGLRGSDVDYNPVFLAHLLISRAQAVLFIDCAKLPAEVAHYLYQHDIKVQPYDQVNSTLRTLAKDSVLLINDQTVTAGTLTGYLGHLRTCAPNPSTLLKACKSEVEIEHIRQTMAYDGAALCEFFAWFEQTIDQRAITELEVDQQITAARACQPHFISPSFGTIAAFGPNAAMPHYQATEKAYALIQGNGLLLIDSGGQYLGGTTDITRVVAVGTPSAEQKRDFTLVLKGMIALSKAVFAKGITGQQLDVIARMPLWQAGVDFGHGTGHGVGYFLNVHEGPQSISWRTRPGSQPQPILPGMITSNEPGLYRAGQWGIRIENLIVCQPHLANEFAELYAFETLTLCPIDTRCIDATLLDNTEVEWLNQYHQKVYQRLSPLVQAEPLAWLEQRTQPLATTIFSN